MAAVGCAAFLAFGASAAPARAQAAPPPNPWAACAQAAAAAEAEAGVPPGLLLAIGKVESGRTDPATGRLTPWPYAVNVAGRGVLAADAASAVTEVQAARAGGQWSVDVGCFQVSLLHHPAAFESLQAGFDPARNARYAASFLARLRGAAASWEEAAGRYHSATPGLAEPYAARVMAAWAGRDAGPVLLAGRLVQPVGVRFGMRVFTPGAAPALVEALTGRGRRLPVVFRPTGDR